MTGAASSMSSAARSKCSPAMACAIASAPVAVRLVPVARPTVELGDPSRVLVEQPGPEHVGEEVVVAVPGAPIVERDEEQVRPVEVARGWPCRRSRPVTASHSGPVSGQDRGLEQEAADVVGLAFEHLLDEVVEDEAVVAGEPGDERS